MSKKIVFILAVVISFMFGNEKVAVTIKVQGDVTYKGEDEKDFSRNLISGNSLENKDEIKLGNDAFGSIVFLDDKSLLNLHENTQFQVQRTEKESKLIKKITMEYGKLKARVNKDKNNEFIIATPTSVAAVKGTIFWVISDRERGDTFYGIEGEVEIQNLITDEKIRLNPNERGRSLKDGTLRKTQISENQLPTEDNQNLKKIRIKFENDEGETKYLEINYEE